jgi:hypothetical protein
MAFLRYSEPELRDLIGRAISVRWPGERIVIVTPCRANLSGVARPWQPYESDAVEAVPGATVAAWADGGNDAVVAATQSRLIYQERMTHTAVVRAIAIILGVLAVLTLFFGDGLSTFAMIGTAALTLWSVSKLAELFLVGRTSMEYERIELIDPLGQQFEGTVQPGTTFRLRVLDPSDFRVILSLLSGYGRAAA